MVNTSYNDWLVYDYNMNVFVLGGESPRHQEWVRQVAEVLKPAFEHVAFQDYRHWADGSTTDIDHEAAEAAKIAAGLGEYVIVAKSIGTVITTLGIGKGSLAPSRCVFLGLPLGAVRRIPGVVEGIKLLPQTIFVQNAHDPLGSADEVKSFVGVHGNSQASTLATPGDTHDYADLSLIAKLASQE